MSSCPGRGAVRSAARQVRDPASALACAPDILICDEAVSALDVSIQAQILNLLVDLQERLKVAMLFISHDPDVVAYLADRIIVVKNGALVGSDI